MSIGISKEEFFDSTPKDLECYVEAERIREKRKDSDMWRMGMYEMSAVMVAVSRALNGKKSHAKYLEEPMYEKALSENKADEELTEDEKEIARKNLLLSLQVMQTNFELNHSGEDD